MRIESDQIEITAGVRHGRTIGSPIAFVIGNRDWENWRLAMAADPVPPGTDTRSITRPRPGHADLAGALKFQLRDVRNVLERASARETAARVAAGSFCRLLLRPFSIEIGSQVLAIGPEEVSEACQNLAGESILESRGEAGLGCAEPDAADRMKALIHRSAQAGDTLGGVLEVVAVGVPPGLGSCAQWDRRLDGLIAQALMSIPAAKAVEIGQGVRMSRSKGSEAHDEIFFEGAKGGFYRKTNRAGGVEGGISNGEEVRARVYMKPIPTLRKPLASVDLVSKAPVEAAFERSDICVVPAAAVIAEAMLALVLAGAFLEKFGGDTIEELGANVANFRRLIAGL